MATNATVSIYKVSTVAANYRTGVSSTDTATAAGVSGLTALDVESKPTISVSIRTSVASATVEIMVIRYTSGDVIQGLTSRSATAKSFQDSSSNYLCDDQLFDTGGCDRVRIAITSISSGNVELWVRHH